MSTSRFLAFDCGATSGRAILGTFTGGSFRMEEVYRFPNQTLEIGGKYYWNVYSIYEHILKCLKELGQRHIPLDSIGIDTWGVDFGCIGHDGTLLGLPRGEHYRRTHTANNMRFIIAGKLKGRKHRLVKMLEAWNLKEGKEFEIPLTELHSSEAVSIRRKDASNITFGFSLVTPRHLDPSEVFAMSCLNHILNGTTNSKIFGAARKRGLVYGMGSSIASNAHNSYWDFDGEVNVENAEELFALIQTEMMKVLNGEVSDADFEAARLYALGRLQMGAQTVGQIADYYAENYFTNESVEKYDNMPNLIRSIDRGLMIELAREFAGSGIKGFATVSSVEKALISNLETRLNF